MNEAAVVASKTDKTTAMAKGGGRPRPRPRPRGLSRPTKRRNKSDDRPTDRPTGALAGGRAASAARSWKYGKRRPAIRVRDDIAMVRYPHVPPIYRITAPEHAFQFSLVVLYTYANILL